MLASMGRIDQRLCVYGRCSPRPLISGTYRGEIKTDFIFWGSKITADGDCNHENKRHLLLETRHLLLETKAMTNLDSILKSRDITLPTNVYLVKAMAFPIVMYGCESWTIKKAEHDLGVQW